MSTITIDGKSFNSDDLTDQAKIQIVHLQYCDQEIGRLETKVAVIKTARLAYARALNELLPKSEN